MDNLTDLFSTYQNNVLEGMVRLLADELNVSTDGIRALGVGFWPYEQAWIFAERNAQGEIIGLMRRYIRKSKDGNDKYALSNSKRGLTYILNSEFKGGKLRGDSLLQDFIRVNKAKVNCSICGKPDWCLVSRDDPEDPAEVICPRPEYKKGSVRQVGGAGWLHIRDKDRARLSSYQGNAGPLLPSDLPYLVVEGASDVLAAYDLGLVAIGKPNNTGGLAELGILLRGKKAVIIGENDRKKNAKGIWVYPGKEGMEITFTKLQKFSKQVSKIMPPTGVKDLRDWVRHGLTKEKLLKYIDANADTKTDKNLIEDPSPLGIANQWLKEKHTDGIYVLLRRHRGKYWKYNNTCYKETENEEVRTQFYSYLENKYYVEMKETKSGIETVRKAYNPDKFKIAKIEDALLLKARIRNGSDTDEPFFIQGYKNESEFDPTRQIVFKDGMLDIETNEFRSLSPELFITSTISHKYDPNAACPLWLKTLRDWFGTDSGSIRLLQQWMGYNLITNNKLQKMMILYGVPGSGKSTVTNVLQEILGEAKHDTLTFKDISYTFGMEKVVGKNMILFAEDELTKRVDAGAVLSIIKRITGGSSVGINVKHGKSYSTKLFARITYECNTLPAFADNSQALERRVMILCFNRSFKDAPNTELTEQLIKEAPGIINWAVEGLRDLNQTNEFIIPGISEVAKEELRYITSTLAAMGATCLCFDDPDARTPTRQLFDLHIAWCKENRDASYSRMFFGKKLIEAFPGLKKCKIKTDTGRLNAYAGVSISPEAIKDYLDGPD